MEGKSDGLAIKALRFQYRKGVTEHNFETMPFYLKVLRGFLRINMGKVVWLKGGIIEQPAYLVFYSLIQDKVTQMLGTPLADLGKFEVTPVSKPLEVTQKYVNQQRVALGWLKLPQYELGSIETITPLETEVSPIWREGFMLTEYLFIKADDAEEKGEWTILKNVVELGLSEGSQIAYIEFKAQMGLRTEDLHFHQTQINRKKSSEKEN